MKKLIIIEFLLMFSAVFYAQNINWMNEKKDPFSLKSKSNFFRQDSTGGETIRYRAVKNESEKSYLPKGDYVKYVSSDYIASIYMKNNKFNHHFFNLKTKKQMMTSLSTKNKPYIPVGFHLDSSTYYAVVYAHDINNHIDTDLLLDKSVLDKISDDDNPVIIKYHLKV